MTATNRTSKNTARSQDVRPTCALCLLQRELRDSHLLPAALYRYIGQADGEVDAPVLVTPKIAVATSHQYSGYLLCDECEGKFNRWGENDVLAVCSRSPASFPLLERLREMATLPGMPSRYDARQLGSLRTSMVYFAISVVWRWSVGHRLWTDLTLAPRRLGPFEDALRPFLMGSSPKPGSVHVLAQALTWEHGVGLLFLPVGDRAGSPRSYEFWIPGIRFRVHVGKGISQEESSFALSGDRLPTIDVCDVADLQSNQFIIDHVAQAVPRGKLARGERA